MEMAYRYFCTGSMILLTILSTLVLIRCILGPRISDRIMAVNMIGTLGIIMIGTLTVFLGEGYLADIGMIYAILSFLAVVVLCKVYMGVYRERKHAEREQGGK